MIDSALLLLARARRHALRARALSGRELLRVMAFEIALMMKRGLMPVRLIRRVGAGAASDLGIDGFTAAQFGHVQPLRARASCENQNTGRETGLMRTETRNAAPDTVSIDASHPVRYMGP